MPRGRKPKNSATAETTSEKTQKAEIVQKNDKPEESDEEMAELPTAVEETKSKRTISKSSTVPKTKKQKKSDDDEEEEEKPTKAQNGKGAKPKATTEPETAEEKATKSQNGKATKMKAAPESEPMAVDEKTTKNQNGRSSKSQPEPEPAEEKVTKSSGKVAAKTTESVGDKKPAPKRTGRGRPPKQTEKVSDTEPEPVVEKETSADSNVDEKPAPKRGGKAKNVKQVEKIVADDDDDDAEPDAEKEAGKEEISADASIDEDSFDSNSKTKDGRKWNFKISTWNICGMRAWLKKGGLDYLKKESPDVIVLQETKVTENDLTDEMKNVDGYNSHFVKVTGDGGKKGYAGVALYSKTKPISVTFGMGIKEHDIDGRLITAEYEKFYLIGAYVPNSGRGLVRLDQRRVYNKDFLEYIKRLDAKKPVVYCGDLNVAHNEIDLKNPASNKKSAGFTKEEREDFTTLLNSGFVDTFRSLYPKRTGAYTYWSNMSNSRAKNVGWRLDYFVVSKRFEENVCDNVIRSKVMGSDHCPSTLFLAL